MRLARGTYGQDDWRDRAVLALGGGGGGPSGNTTTTQTNTPWAGQQPYLTDSTPGANGVAQGVFPNAYGLYSTYTPQYFNQSTVSPLTGAQNSALGTLSNAGLAAPVSDAATGYSAGTLNNGVAGLQPYANGSMLNSAQPAIDAAVQKATPGLMDAFTGGNRLNSPAAAQGVSSGIASAAAPYVMQEQQNQINAAGGQAGIQNQALAQAPLTATVPYVGANQQLQAGTTQQTQNQAQLTDLVNRWNYQQQLPYNQLATYQQMIQGNYGGTGTLTQPYFSQGDNTAGQVMQGLGTAASIAALAFSDSRLKENITPVGTDRASGLPVYDFNYLWDKTPTRGFMAQEVEAAFPQAVRTHPSGALMVDYGVMARLHGLA